MKKRITAFIFAMITISNLMSYHTLAMENEANNEENLVEENNIIEDDSYYYNQSYTDYMNRIKDLPEDEYEYKKAMAPSEYSYNEVPKSSNMLARTVENRGISSYINAYKLNSKEQGNPYLAQSGWAFGVNDALEANLYKNGLSTSIDFSAQHLRFAICKDNLSTNYQNYGVDRGGIGTARFVDASAYWMRSDLNGPVLEDNMFYNINEIENTDDLISCKKSDYTVTDTIEISSISEYADYNTIKNRVELLKEFVQSYGAVYVAYDHFDGGFNSKTSAYHNPGGAISNGKECANGVVIIGWDDNYSRENFGEYKPQKNGAFIVKANRLVDVNPNSIDTQPVHLGNYYLSYEMTPYFYDCGAVGNVEKDVNYEKIFEYDKTAPEGVSCYNTTSAVYANKYTNTTGKPLQIKTITTYACVPNSSFQIFISPDGNMGNLKKVSISEKNYNGYMGYKTFTVETPIAVENEFAIAIQVSTANATSKIIPQEKNSGNNSTISGRCFVSSTIDSMKNGNYIDQGSRNNIIKVNTINANREWYFGSSEFQELSNPLTEDKEFNGLTLSAGIGFRNKQKVVKGKTYTGNLDLKITRNSIPNYMNIELDGPSNVYFIAQTNAAGYSRRLSIENKSTNETGYIEVNEAKGYCYKYRGSKNTTLQIKSIDETIRIYAIMVENYDECKYEYLDDYSDRLWNFQNITSGATITSTIDLNKGLKIIATENKSVNYVINNASNENGFKYVNAIDLLGVGNEEYRSLAIDVESNSNIYITARDLSNSGRQMIITDKYGCDLDIKDNLQMVSLSDVCKTYKFSYFGEADTLYIHSLSDSIRIYQVAVTDYENKVVNETNCRFDDLEYPIGTNLAGKTIGEMSFEGGSAGISMCSSTDVNYSKAVRIYGNKFDNAGKIKLNIASSLGLSNNTPERKIRIKAKANYNGGKIVLANKYGYVYGSFDLSTNMSEYVVDYNGENETMYLFITSGIVEIYSISTTDVNYNADVKTISVNVKTGQTYRYLFNVENAPASDVFIYTIEYDPTKLKYIHIGKDNNFNGVVSDSSISDVKFSSGKITFRVVDPQSKDWSGIVTSVVFEGLADGISEIKFSATKRTGWGV